MACNLDSAIFVRGIGGEGCRMQADSNENYISVIARKFAYMGYESYDYHLHIL